ncbi:MAG: hypothetical protein ABH856_00325 [Patescibacteria group bacterium]|nr:hypothetical protein [Patescibacteria group bacterium]
MNKTCAKCSTPFEVTDDDLKFYDSISPVFDGHKCAIPAPNYCPECRQQRRLAICNERNLYPGKCDMCKKYTLSGYSPELKRSVYCRDCWHSEKWDSRDYGQDFDFNRPFFEQIAELWRRVPALALNSQGNCVNSDYIHYAGWSKNCYLIMHADFCEDCYYGYGFKKNLFCVDGFYNLHSELCYDCVDVHKCYGLTCCQDCNTCNTSAFLRDCIGCSDCFLCVGLRNQRYCFRNEKLTKEEYQKRMKEVDTGSHKQYQQYKKERMGMEKKHIFKEFQGNNLVNCFGNHLNHCKDLYYSFDCEDVEGGKYCYQLVLGAKNNYDVNQFGTNIQQSYECTICGENSYHLLFCDNAMMDASDLIYCWYMESSKNCFGCTSMQGASYCVLNKQYSKKEYEELVPKIIEHMKNPATAGCSTGEWGEFFPSNISPHGYNKTTAQMYYPLTKEQALKGGFKWDDYEVPSPKVDNVIEAADLPDNIDDVSDDILDSAIKCEATGKLFKITPQELKFYRRQRIPLPRRWHDQRHLDRFHQRNPRKFWERKCGKCEKKITTTYSPDTAAAGSRYGGNGPETVYCEECYMKELY